MNNLETIPWREVSAYGIKFSIVIVWQDRTTCIYILQRSYSQLFVSTFIAKYSRIVMQDLQILEQQQQEAQRKLLSAQNIKQKRLDQQRQLNTLLEEKNYTNGVLRAKLQQSRQFLSIATRELGNRKLETNRLEDGIKEFDCKLKKGLESTKMMQISGGKIDSFLITIEHLVTNKRNLRMKVLEVSSEIRKKYEQTEKKDRMLRVDIQDAHKRARKLGEEKATLQMETSELDNDKMAAQNLEQESDLQIQSAYDQIKAEEDRGASLNRTLSSDIEQAKTKSEKISSEIAAASTSLDALKVEVQGYRDKILQCKKIEGYSEENDDSPFFDQHKFKEDLARLEEEKKKDEDELLALEKVAEETELKVKTLSENNIENDKKTSLLSSSAEALTEQENKRQKDAVDFQVSLEYARAEVAKLEERYQEMLELQKSEACADFNATSDYDVETKKQLKIVEDLKLKIKSEETSLREEIRLFEDTEKPLLEKKLDAAKKKSLDEQKKYKNLVEIYKEESIERKLQAEFGPKFDDETMKWDTTNKELISRCNKHLKSK